MALQSLRPRVSGGGKLPRYGGGYMYQFGHVYCLQYELLQPRQSGDWFRACELWHTARHEGLALNVAHYRCITRQMVPAAQWQTALAVVAQMGREAIRPDAAVAANVVAACVEAGQWEAGVQVFDTTVTATGMRVNEQLALAVARAMLRGGQWQAALRHAESHVLSEPSVTALLEASAQLDEESAMMFVAAVRRATHRALPSAPPQIKG
jgi:hypothetical protein